MLSRFLALIVVLAFLGLATAGFDPNSKTNIAVYWGT